MVRSVDSYSSSQASRNKKRSHHMKMSRFQHRELGNDERKYLMTKAHECADTLIRNISSAIHNRGPIQWHGMEGGSEDVRMLRGEPKSRSNAKETELHGLVRFRINSTLAEAASFFDMATNEKMAECLNYFQDLSEGEVVHLIEDLPEIASQITVKWGLTRLPIVTDRDFVVLECQRRYTDALTGRPAWVRAYNSIKLPDCPDMNNYVRSRVYHTGFVMVEGSKPGTIDVTYMLHINMKGKLRIPSFARKRILKRRLKAIAGLGTYMHQKAMDMMYCEHDTSTLPTSSAVENDYQLEAKRVHPSRRDKGRTCEGCFSKVDEANGETTSKCKKCQEEMCKNCSCIRSVMVPGVGMTPFELCQPCGSDLDSPDNTPVGAHELHAMPKALDPRESDGLSTMSYGTSVVNTSKPYEMPQYPYQHGVNHSALQNLHQINHGFADRMQNNHSGGMSGASVTLQLAEIMKHRQYLDDMMRRMMFEEAMRRNQQQESYTPMPSSAGMTVGTSMPYPQQSTASNAYYQNQNQYRRDDIPLNGHYMQNSGDARQQTYADFREPIPNMGYYNGQYSHPMEHAMYRTPSINPEMMNHPPYMLPNGDLPNNPRDNRQNYPSTAAAQT